ncbi:MAG: hypothetical protein R3E97_01805 [Candidatus Eisenbacteria bacterium]
MTDEELIARFIQVRRSEDEVLLLVQTIQWHGPHTPVSECVVAKTLPPGTSDVQVEKAVSRLVTNRKYFRACVECHERNPVGWMSGDSCHGCAERDGIVF